MGAKRGWVGVGGLTYSKTATTSILGNAYSVLNKYKRCIDPPDLANLRILSTFGERVGI